MGKKITKALATVVLLVILGYFGGTWYAGTKVDEQVFRRTQDINAQLRSNGLPVQISTEKKDTGLFTSSYVLTLRMDNAGQSHSLDFNVEVEHGPLPLSRLQQGKLAPVQALSHVTLIKNDNTARLFDLSQNQPPLELLLTTALNGSTRYQGSLASLSFNNSRDGQLHFDGMTFEGTVDATHRLADFAGNMPLMQVTPPKNENGTSTLIFRGMALSSHFDGRNADSPVLQQQSSLKELSLTSDKADLRIRDYQSGMKTDTQDNLLSLQQNTALNAIRINNIDFGKLEYGFAAAGLDRAGATQFMTQTWQMLFNASQSGNQKVSQQQWVPLLASLDRMLSGKPTITVGPIVWSLPEGAAKASAKVALNNPVPLLSKLGNDPFALLINTLRSVHIELDADQAMPQGAVRRFTRLTPANPGAPASTAEPTAAEKLNTIIDILVKNQLLSRKQGHVSLSVAIDGDPSLATAGNISMNGETLDPAGFVGTIQERAAAAELQIRQLTPPQPESESESPAKPEEN